MANNNVIKSLLLTLAVAPIACAAEEDPNPPGVWYHVELNWPAIHVMRADPNADTCVVATLSLQAPGTNPDQAPSIDSNLGEFYVQQVNAGASASVCRAPASIGSAPVEQPGMEPVEGIRGSVSFSDTVDSGSGFTVGCTVAVDLELEDNRSIFDGMRLFARGQRIIYPVCERPIAPLEQLDNLRAELGPDGELVFVLDWNRETEVCTWLTLAPIGNNTPLIEFPTGWGFLDSRRAYFEDAASCSAAYLDANIQHAHVETMIPEREGATNVVRFPSTESVTVDGETFELPCEIDVDISTIGFNRYYWAQKDARLLATGLPVAGACGN